MDKEKFVLAILFLIGATFSFTIKLEKFLKLKTSIATSAARNTSQSYKARSLGANSYRDIFDNHKWEINLIPYMIIRNAGTYYPLKNVPHSSFRVLNKLKDIAFKSCAGIAPKTFLEDGYVLFEAAYQGKRTNQTDYLTKEAEVEILELLNYCHDSLDPLKFSNNGSLCSDEITTVEVDNKYVDISFTSEYHSDYYLQDRHLTMEIPWSMVDLSLAMCFDAFSGSLMLYRKMKHAMEKLFIKELQILWEKPPKYMRLYALMHGPYWKENAENLEKCVQGAFIVNPKLVRLRRPKTRH